MRVCVDPGDVPTAQNVDHAPRVDRAPQIRERRPESKVEPIDPGPVGHFRFGDRRDDVNRLVERRVYQPIELDEAGVSPHVPLLVGHRPQPPGHGIAIDHRIVGRIEPVHLNLTRGAGRVAKQDIDHGRALAPGRGERPQPAPALICNGPGLLAKHLHVAVVFVIVNQWRAGALPSLRSVGA